jgi:hypothetical protein
MSGQLPFWLDPEPGSEEALRRGCLCERIVLKGSRFEPDAPDRLCWQIKRECRVHGVAGLPEGHPRRLDV